MTSAEVASKASTVHQPGESRAPDHGLDNPNNRTTMKAAVLTGEREWSIREAPVPEPDPTQVRVRLEGCGVCGSNMPPWEGRPWFGYPFDPGNPGHEGWGAVDAVGSEVTEFNIGDRVTMLSYHAFAEFDVAEASAVVRLPDALKERPFPGEALGCAMNVWRRAEIRSGDTVAIVGLGFLGSLVAQLAVREGARVIAITRRESALDIARSFGISDRIVFDAIDPVTDRVNEITAGNLCDVVIEATGFADPLTLAGHLTGIRSKLVIAGFHQDGPREINMQEWNWRGIDVINAHERDPEMYRSGMKDAVEAVASGRLDPTPLYTHAYSLHEINRAFETAHDRPDGFMKSLVLTGA
ncbi:MAG: MDR/zinc-dependent alcohol dehydrogenase-like family protein [Planctomycetota bacterium]